MRFPVLLCFALLGVLAPFSRAQSQPAPPVFSSEIEMKIASGHFLIRRKGAADWTPSLTSDEPVEIGWFDGNRKIYLESKGIVPPKAKHNEPPEWPRNSGRSFVSQSVLLHAVVDTNGKVRFAHADKSPGQEFTNESIRAVEKWTFEPAKLNGQLVAVLIVIEMIFQRATDR
jgi:TonB family protein